MKKDILMYNLNMKIFVNVKPNSKYQKVVQENENTFTIYATSLPVENKVNKELIDILKKYFKTSKSNIEIKSGLKSKNKVFEIN